MPTCPTAVLPHPPSLAARTHHGLQVIHPRLPNSALGVRKCPGHFRGTRISPAPQQGCAFLASFHLNTVQPSPSPGCAQLQMASRWAGKAAPGQQLSGAPCHQHCWKHLLGTLLGAALAATLTIPPPANPPCTELETLTETLPALCFSCFTR